jgi:hypothetical protein
MTRAPAHRNQEKLKPKRVRIRIRIAPQAEDIIAQAQRKARRLWMPFSTYLLLLIEKNLHHQHQMKTTCPICKATGTDFTPVDAKTRTPKPGDIACCANCSTLIVFSQDMSLRRATPEDFDLLHPADSNSILFHRAALLVQIITNMRTEIAQLRDDLNALKTACPPRSFAE